MAEPTATLETERDVAPTLEETLDGWRGTRNYRVNTHDEMRAMNALGVPQTVEPWDAQNPTLIASRRVATYLHGTDDPSTNIGGTTRVRVEYETPGRRGRIVVPEVGFAYTEWEPATDTVNVLFQIEDPNTPYVIGPPIANGQGAPVEVSRLGLKVHVFYDLSYRFPAEQWLGIQQKVNRNLVRLPPLQRDGSGFDFAPGQLRYRMATPRVNGGTIEVVHDLVAAPDHFFRWMPEDSNGYATGSTNVSLVYPKIDFPPLF